MLTNNMILLPECLWYGVDKWINLRHIVAISSKVILWGCFAPDGWKLNWRDNKQVFYKGPFWNRIVREPTLEEINGWDYAFDITTTNGLFRCGYFTKSEAEAKIKEVRNAVDFFNRE